MNLKKTRIVFFVAVCSSLFSCGLPDTAFSIENNDDDTSATLFVEVAASAGLSFTHHNGNHGTYNFPEINGAGGALLDFDNDGDLDVYLVQSGHLPGTGTADNMLPRAANALYRNMLVPSGELIFEDVTAMTGTGNTGYGIGVATGDYDNDGDVDMYVMNVGDNIFYRNDDGVFTDVTDHTGTSIGVWSASGSFADYDQDGDLDLFVANYVDWQADAETPCQNNAGQRDYCAPVNYPALSDHLFRNNGDGTFTDVSKLAGISALSGPGLGVTAADFNADNQIDFYVANDQQANFLWLNRGDGVFVENGLRSGSAYNSRGVAEASMGVTAGDFDGDGDEDLFMTHLSSESNTLYINDGTGNFVDGTETANLGASSMRFTGFGSAWIDYDNDSLLDLFVANGSHMIVAERRNVSDFPYGQSNQLFRNIGGGRFTDMSNNAGPAMSAIEISRGAAFGDIDNDGDVDILVTNNNGPVRLLLNESGHTKHWLRLRLGGTRSPRDAQGARVAVFGRNNSTLWKRVHTDGSYASASDARVLFGLGADAPSDMGVQVQWPSGHTETFGQLQIDREHYLQEGTGSPGPLQNR
ncbi:MAG: CRTAC1 family protein [Gammaproteobacteria bacterium]|nr:CRTAC1 family protein [Gammaproteobacteria bacterium]